jgi:hypothetical protein
MVAGGQPFCYRRVMTKVELAIAKLRALPKDQQEEWAQMVLELAEPPSDFRLSAEQLAEIELSKQEAREGKFATKEEMADLWRRFRE